MRKKIATYILSGCLLSMSMLNSSCTKDFNEINTNPNASTVASPQSLLAPTLVAVINANLNRNFRVNNEFMQVTVTTSNSDARQFHRYEVRPSESDYMWRNWYLQLTNIRDIYIKAEESQLAGYQTFKGISLILDAWVSSLLTDMFGDVPYFESNLGYSEQNTTPKFDKQKDIYEDLFRKLEEANYLLKQNDDLPNELVNADPIYGGKASSWRKFGNSMYMRLLMRVAHTGEFDAQEKMWQIVQGVPVVIDEETGETITYPIFDNNDESAILKFSGELPYQTAFHNTRDFDFNGDKGLSQFFINNLSEMKDPRLPRWAMEATLGVYSGMQSGYIRGASPEIESKLQLSLKSEPLLGNIMNYAELQFILAEAALNGYVEGNPIDFYEEGVLASIEMWGEEVDPSTYFLNPAVSFEEAVSYQQKMEKIHLQKYFSVLFTDFQQWYEYRRTKALNLYEGPGLSNGGNMPSRLTYPILVRTFNNENYQAAVEEMGGDSINEKVWWEKN